MQHHLKVKDAVWMRVLDLMDVGRLRRTDPGTSLLNRYVWFELDHTHMFRMEIIDINWWPTDRASIVLMMLSDEGHAAILQEIEIATLSLN